MEVTKNPLIKKVSPIQNLTNKNKNEIIKTKQDIKSIQNNKFILNDILHKNKKPIYLISQRNSKKKYNEKPMLASEPTDNYTKDIIIKRNMIKAFSHKNIDKIDKSTINPSKLLVNKKYELIKKNLDINQNIEINNDYEYTDINNNDI